MSSYQKRTQAAALKAAKLSKSKKNALPGTEPKGLVLNQRELRKFKEIAYDNREVEFLYLRENEFESFDPYIPLLNLKILDLSLNNLVGSIDFLYQMPALRHLYLTGNGVSSLKGIRQLEYLETLCMSSNNVSSFEGLDSLPNLRVLSLNYNNISSFRHFPFLPQLNALNLVGNPIAELPSYRPMAIAICSQMLSSIDAKPIEPAEREEVDVYRGKVVYCITEGFKVEGVKNVEEAADEFLLDLQREESKGKPLRLQSISLTPDTTEAENNVIMEGVPIKLNVCLQDMRTIAERRLDVFHSKVLFPVAFKVSGDATEVFVVGSMNNWAEPIPLERYVDDEDGKVYFQTTLYLPADDYEYRYMVDGVEKISEQNKIASKYSQGICNLYKVSETTAEENEEDQDTILHIRWMRNNRYNGFTLIDDENGLTYTPTNDDIGFCLRAEVLIYLNGDFSFLVFDISAPIAPGFPRCKRLEIIGQPAEGEVLEVEVEYEGGHPGDHQLSWFRVMPSGEDVPLEMEDPWQGYTITVSDIGRRIKVEYVPIRNDWVAGSPVSQTTNAITAGVPVCRDMRIRGDLRQNEAITVETDYRGGFEGKSKYQWYRYDEKADEYTVIPGETSPTYVPTLNDVYKRLAVEYTPVSREGIEGEPNRIVADRPVAAAAPTVKRLFLKGTCVEQHPLMLEYDYFGGFHGVHNIQWFRKDADTRKLTKIGKANMAMYTITRKEVGHFIEVHFTPVRDDGASGPVTTVTTEEKIRPGDPQLMVFDIAGTPKVGNVLEVVVEYFGGEQGESTIEWARSIPPTKDYDVIAKTRRWVVCPDDAGKSLKVTYTPVRKDGVQGEPKSRYVEIEP